MRMTNPGFANLFPSQKPSVVPTCLWYVFQALLPCSPTVGPTLIFLPFPLPLSQDGLQSGAQVPEGEIQCPLGQWKKIPETLLMFISSWTRNRRKMKLSQCLRSGWQRHPSPRAGWWWATAAPSGRRRAGGSAVGPPCLSFTPQLSSSLLSGFTDYII